jgi:hypothetical protein
MELRKCEIEEIQKHNRHNAVIELEICFFHKWFDGLSCYKEMPEQFAIVEMNDGNIKKISIEDYKIRFIN